MRNQGDRRGRVRFEVFGDFWGTFDVGAAVRVRNLTHTGALIEVDQPLPVESYQSICLMLNGEPATSSAQVKHVRALEDQRDRFLVGVEFVSTSSSFRDAINELIVARSRSTESL